MQQNPVLVTYCLHILVGLRVKFHCVSYVKFPKSFTYLLRHTGYMLVASGLQLTTVTLLVTAPAIR